MAIRILLADDHVVMRQGLSYLLKREKDFDIVGEAENGRTAIKLASELKPNVIIMDAAMPIMGGIEATRQILENDKEIKILALTVHSDENYLSGMLQAGAAGYLLKDCVAEELVGAVRLVAAGKGYISPEVAPFVLKAYTDPRNTTINAEGILTQRELKILKLVADGMGEKGIAIELGLSYKTIVRCRNKLMQRLSLYSVAELTKYAIKLGLTELDKQ